MKTAVLSLLIALVGMGSYWKLPPSEPSMQVTLDPDLGTQATVKEVRQLVGLRTACDDCSDNEQFVIKSFVLSVLKRSQGMLFEILVEGSRLPESATEIINQVQSGDKLWFDNIIVLDQNADTVIFNLELEVE